MPWRQKEIDFLVKYHSTHSIEHIAGQVKRSPNAVRCMASRLKLRKIARPDPEKVRKPVTRPIGPIVGVYPSHGKWRAKLRGKHLGVFATRKEAAKAYNVAAFAEYGESATQNDLEAIAD